MMPEWTLLFIHYCADVIVTGKVSVHVKTVKDQLLSLFQSLLVVTDTYLVT